MRVVLLVAEVWLAVDVLFIVLWFVISARRRRAAIADLVDAAERHANRAEADRPLSRTG